MKKRRSKRVLQGPSCESTNAFLVLLLMSFVLLTSFSPQLLDYFFLELSTVFVTSSAILQNYRCFVWSLFCKPYWKYPVKQRWCVFVWPCRSLKCRLGHSIPLMVNSLSEGFVESTQHMTGFVLLCGSATQHKLDTLHGQFFIGTLPNNAIKTWCKKVFCKKDQSPCSLGENVICWHEQKFNWLLRRCENSVSIPVLLSELHRVIFARKTCQFAPIHFGRIYAWFLLFWSEVAVGCQFYAAGCPPLS